MFARFKRWLYRGDRPNGLARLLNRGAAVIHALGIAPNYMVTLKVVGRRSGRPITFPLAMVTVDGERYLVSMLGANAGWVRNVRAAGGQATLIHGRTEKVRLEDPALGGAALDKAEIQLRARVLKEYLRRAPGARPHLPVDKDAPLEAFEALAAQTPIFRVLVDSVLPGSSSETA